MKIRKKPKNPDLYVNISNTRTCAIVGNAKSIFGKSQGAEIDNHNEVIRINTPIIISPVDQGLRTTALYVHNLTMHNVPTNKRFRVCNISMDLYTRVDSWSRQIAKDCNDPKARPTTGFVTIMHCIERNFEISLYGFDWFKTPTHYQNTQGHWEHHHPEWEEQKLKSLLKLPPNERRQLMG